MRALSSTLSFVVAAAIAAAPAAAAQQVIDQNQPIALSGFAAMYQGWSGQSFVQSGANISGFGLFMRSINGSTATSPVQYRIYDAVPNGPNSPNILVSGTENVTLGASESRWIDFFFTPYALAPGASLFLAVTGPSAAFQVYDDFIPLVGPYAAGQAYLENAGGNSAVQGYDLTFRTYTTLAQPIATPEPASLTLLATGLIGIAGAVRRRATRIA